MPRAEPIFVSIARRPAARAAALLWIWLAALFAPLGATLHAMSHLDLPGAAAHGQASASPRQGARAGADADTAASVARQPGTAHGAAAHCHVCDEWQFLDHALPVTALAALAAGSYAAPADRPFLPRRPADRPWILPRAPPATLSGTLAWR
ncbi:hypothetical protein ACL598_13640 [Bordetella bronchialis]|uniref:hypothetical protein n=1 Tax=Bordetella bronchialis TaxID=463025 RepID=UPI003D04A589